MGDTLRMDSVPSSSKKIIENFESMITLHYTADYQILDEYPVGIDESFYFWKEFLHILSNSSQTFPKHLMINGHTTYRLRETKNSHQRHLVGEHGNEVIFKNNKNDIISYREKYYAKIERNSLDGSITNEENTQIDRQVTFKYDSNGNLIKKELPGLTLFGPSIVEYTYLKSKSNPHDFYILISKSKPLEPKKILKILHVHEHKLSRVYHCEQNPDNVIAVKRGSVVTEDDHNRIHSYVTETNLADTTYSGNYNVLPSTYYFNYNEENNISSISLMHEDSLIEKQVYKYYKQDGKLQKYEVYRLVNDNSELIRSIELPN